MTAFSGYIVTLRTPPEPLTRWERRVVWALFAIVFVSRFFALSQSQLDWDESLFSSAVREYDVVPHHPHPPGYPIFILLAKVARLVLRDDYRSLQAVSTLASALLFPVTLWLLRELRFRFPVAAGAALLTSFLPTVWFHGGTALSDVPALTSIVVASALLLRSAHDPRAWMWGMAATAVTAGIRPQHLLIAAMPALLAAIAIRRVRTILSGVAVCALLALIIYAGAAFASSDPPMGYLKQVDFIARYIGTTDSFANQSRPPLKQLAPTFFVTPHRGGLAGTVMLICAAVALVDALFRRSVAVAILVAMFVPIAILSWMMLDMTAVTRYALAYILLYSVLAVQGMDAVARVLAFGLVPLRNVFVALGAAAMTVAMAVWTWPALEVVRHRPSPSIEAMRWIAANVPARGAQLWFDDNFGYHANYQLPHHDPKYFNDYAQIPASAYARGNYMLINRVTLQPEARLYRFERGRLADIARVFCFEVSLIPMDRMIRFVEGWYQDEYSTTGAWRWMGRNSVTLLPPMPPVGKLRLRFHVPLDTAPHAPTMTVKWNGAVIDRHLCDQPDIERDYSVPSRTDVNELRLELDTAAHPIELGLTTDSREFGLQLLEIGWSRQ